MNISWKSLRGQVLEEQLRHASYHGLESHLDRILQSSMDVFRAGPNGKTALHWAVMGERVGVVKKLLDVASLHKIQIVNALDYAEQSALHLACKKNNYKICQLLLSRGANPFIKDCFGRDCSQLCTDPSIQALLKLYSNIIHKT